MMELILLCLGHIAGTKSRKWNVLFCRFEREKNFLFTDRPVVSHEYFIATQFWVLFQKKYKHHDDISLFFLLVRIKVQLQVKISRNRPMKMRLGSWCYIGYGLFHSNSPDSHFSSPLIEAIGGRGYLWAIKSRDNWPSRTVLDLSQVDLEKSSA